MTLIPRACKRLVEADFPIAEVSVNASREKSGPKGYPSMLHQWWARRPLASSRAILLGLLLPDPCDRLCPEEFKNRAWEVLPRRLAVTPERTDNALREELLGFIAKISDWSAASNTALIQTAQSLVRAAHPDTTPIVSDPFAGGGSIPLEALRLGCQVVASDLNPVSFNILRALLDDLPTISEEELRSFRSCCEEIQVKSQERLSKFYPADSDGSKPIAYLWARTVRCEAPQCGGEIPLVKSFWLGKEGKRPVALKPVVHREGPATFEVVYPRTPEEVHRGTVHLAKATCLVCNSTLPADRVVLN